MCLCQTIFHWIEIACLARRLISLGTLCQTLLFVHIGVEQSQPPHWRHSLLMAIQLFAFAAGDDELGQACEAQMVRIRTEVGAASND